jgi:hypothetical protein
MLSYFSDRVLHGSPTCTFCIAGIIGMNYHIWPKDEFFLAKWYWGFELRASHLLGKCRLFDKVSRLYSHYHRSSLSFKVWTQKFQNAISAKFYWTNRT